MVQARRKQAGKSAALLNFVRKGILFCKKKPPPAGWVKAAENKQQSK